MIVRTLMVACLVLTAGLAEAATPAQICQSGKNKAAGKYAACRQSAEAKFATTGDGPTLTEALQKCIGKYDATWQKLETKAAGACESTSDQGPIRNATDTHTTNIAGALAGGTLEDCPADLTTCEADLTTAEAGLTTAEAELAACEAASEVQFLQTGSNLCFDRANTGPAAIPCAGTGQDGESQRGVPRGYVNNGDGTITDVRTGLMWEQQNNSCTKTSPFDNSYCPGACQTSGSSAYCMFSLHDNDNFYTWEQAFTVKIPALNAGGGLAGYTDWRLPNRAELESLLDLSVPRATGISMYPHQFRPRVAAAFNTNCTYGCTLANCSCTAANYYWSSSTNTSSPDTSSPDTSAPGELVGVWAVDFFGGEVASRTIGSTLGVVRGVRGGS